MIVSVSALPKIISPPIVTSPVVEIFPVTVRFPNILVSVSISTVPVPFGLNSNGALLSIVEIVLPVISKI